MWDPEPGSLPDWIEHAYQVLAPHIDESSEGISQEHAHELLLADDDFEDELADAEYAVKRLLNQGWLYEVDDELRITDPEY